MPECPKCGTQVEPIGPKAPDIVYCPECDVAMPDSILKPAIDLRPFSERGERDRDDE